METIISLQTDTGILWINNPEQNIVAFGQNENSTEKFDFYVVVGHDKYYIDGEEYEKLMAWFEGSVGKIFRNL